MSSQISGWFIALGNELVGPLEPDHIESRFLAGELDITTMAWRPGEQDWRPFFCIDGLEHLAPPTPTDWRPSAGEGLSALVRDNPEGHGMDYVHAYMVISKVS